jgi:hypothetical protein
VLTPRQGRPGPGVRRRIPVRPELKVSKMSNLPTSDSIGAFAKISKKSNLLLIGIFDFPVELVEGARRENA